ncbi:hypothetical protein LINPERHAP2_LOCUS40553 [Linum perenne]
MFFVKEMVLSITLLTLVIVFLAAFILITGFDPSLNQRLLYDSFGISAPRSIISHL